MEKVMYITDKPQSCELCEFCIENHDYNSLGRITLKNYSCVGLGRKEFETVEEMKKHCPLVDYAPTVKAIPVEWLKRWFETQVWQGSSPTDRIHCKASDIIEDWEKENERTRNKV